MLFFPFESLFIVMVCFNAAKSEDTAELVPKRVTGFWFLVKAVELILGLTFASIAL